MLKFPKSIKNILQKTGPLCFIAVICCTISCNKKNLSDEKESDWTEDNFSNYYNYLPELILPYTWEENKYHFKNNYYVLPAKFYPLFGDTTSLFNVHIARLPAFNVFKLLLFYQSGKNGESVDLYSMNDSLKIIDHQKMVSQETINDKSKITQTFIIIEKNQFKTFKTLDGTLIEQLYYAIDSTGIIHEIRNDKLPVIAYETYQDSIYVVESFKWDKNRNGRLYKKEPTQRYYLLDDNGKLTERDTIKINKI